MRTFTLTLALAGCLAGSAYPPDLIAADPPTAGAGTRPEPPPPLDETEPDTTPAPPAATADDTDPVPPPPMPLPTAEEMELLTRHGDHLAIIDRLGPLFPTRPLPIRHRLLLARAYARLDRLDHALAVCDHLLADNGDHAAARRLAGRLHLAAGRHRKAHAHLRVARRLDPTDHHTARLLGLCLLELNENDEALPLLTQTLRADARDHRVARAAARIHLARGAGPAAEDVLLLARDAGDDSLELDLLLGRACLLQGKDIGPVRLRHPSRPLDPGSWDGDELVVGRLTDRPHLHQVCLAPCALTVGHRLLDRQNDHPQGLYLVARGWRALGRRDLAGEALHRLHNIEGPSVRVLELGAELDLAAGDAAAFDADLQALGARLSPERHAALRYRMALRLQAVGERTAAVDQLQRADAVDPGRRDVLLALARLADADDDPGATRAAWSRLADLHADDPRAAVWQRRSEEATP